ncbi:hypothetical protein [Streptomyces sp. NPDC127098]|uniref:hypothetical protein n=1 Tax=Streptomyces sp. NPDC127098 TaxID=3347137 RepID=UPI003659F8D0
MLLSIPESGWYLIAAAATACFVLGMWALTKGMERPGAGWRRRWPLAAGPVLGGVVVVATRLGSEPASVFLFLYSVAFASIPMALLPVRGRLLRATAAYHWNPHAGVPVDRLMMGWIVGFLSVVCLAATIVLMVARYEPGV